MLADVTPLQRSVPYRWLYGGTLVQLTGRQFTVVAVPFQVFELTNSSLAVGLIGVVQLGPLIACSLVGGAIADAVDRRRLLLLTQTLLAVTSAGLALNAASAAPALWLVFTLTAVQAGLSALDEPTRTAVLPALVERRQLPAAYALQQLLNQSSHAVGPALAGVVISQAGVAAAFSLEAVSFVLAGLALLPLRRLPPEGGGRRAGVASILEGLKFLRDRPILQGSFVIDLNAMILGLPRALFPELGTQVFGGGAAAVGLLYAAPGAGALFAAATSGWVTMIRRQGRAVLASVAAWGLAVALFGIVPWLPLGLFLLAVAGAADTVSSVFRNTILQLSVPDALRGRLSAIHVAVVTGGPRLGDAEAGAVAALTTPRFSVVSGGLACVAGVLLVARRWPQFADYVREEAS